MEGSCIPAARANANRTFTLGSSYQGYVKYEKGEGGKVEQMFALLIKSPHTREVRDSFSQHANVVYEQ